MKSPQLENSPFFPTDEIQQQTIVFRHEFDREQVKISTWEESARVFTQ